MARVTREQTATISLSLVGSFVTAVIAIWSFAAPIAQKAMAGEIKDQIMMQLAPINAAQTITITATVKNLQKQISALEFKKEMCAGASCWTLRDAEDLSSAREDLVAAQAALRALKQ
jgi:hypothetical protein